MNIAKITALNSKANRNKVGCVIVKDGNIISMGWNGTPNGFDNNCEDKENKTKQEVVHSEINAICKIAKSTNSSDGATMYVVLSPCFDCAKVIAQSGIKRVVYLEKYRDDSPLKFLKKIGIKVEKI